MIYIAGDMFGAFLRQRQSMDLMWNGQAGLNVWGIGQIGALFAWVPLLVDMACSAAQRFTWRDRPQERQPEGCTDGAGKNTSSAGNKEGNGAPDNVCV